jgi:nucleotide-binding universal stress UspA family protein
MKTILVPTDFSNTSVHAARYALKFAKQTGSKILLLHAYLSPSSMPIPEGLQLTDEGLWELKLEELKKLAEILTEEDPLVKVEFMQLKGTVSEAVNQFADAVQTQLIIMGITGAGKVKESLIGSNTITVAQKTKIPVLIVPEQTEFSPVTDIGFATDFRDVAETVPSQKIKELIRATGARLHVLHVDFQKKYSNADTPFQSGMVETLFQEFFPQYHFIEHENIAEGLSEYALTHGIELLVAVPKKQNFIAQLFSKSQTKALVFHSKVPVMIVHE